LYSAPAPAPAGCGADKSRAFPAKKVVKPAAMHFATDLGQAAHNKDAGFYVALDDWSLSDST
jgi:hypothetical protein